MYSIFKTYTSYTNKAGLAMVAKKKIMAGTRILGLEALVCDLLVYGCAITTTLSL